MEPPTKFTHPSNLNPKLVNKVASRRGKLHAFETITPAKTALVVIDMMSATISNDENCLSLIAPINTMAAELRKNGGTVAWVTQAPDSNGPHMNDIVGTKRASMFNIDSERNSAASRLWYELNAQSDDIHVEKQGFSAFFPGKCDLHNLLAERQIETILITGTVTNVCCESSARDAYEHGYKIIMVSDANAGHSFGLHEATLNTIYRIFGDVRPSREVIEMINA